MSVKSERHSIDQKMTITREKKRRFRTRAEQRNDDGFLNVIARVSSLKVSNTGVFLSEVVHTMRKNTRKDSGSALYLEISNI